MPRKKTRSPDPWLQAWRQASQRFESGGARARLQWLIEFARREDILQAPPEELERIDAEIFCFAAFGSGATGFEGIGSLEEQKSAGTIFKLQESLRSGFRLVTRLDPLRKGFYGWELKLDGLTRVVRKGFSGYRGPRPVVFLAAASELIVSAEGKRILECPRCKRPFFKLRRMRFCSKRCAASQRSKDYRVNKILKQDKADEQGL